MNEEKDIVPFKKTNKKKRSLYQNVNFSVYHACLKGTGCDESLHISVPLVHLGL